ncbi:hypothetical protein FPOAC2_04133 [Fusarium poae]|uniref:hypothetical protein n=1 Tax=Fusarium poae TaxID=36050 RepID=UPI001CEAF158|nr:hypothetical protein FPOAC1_004064 [Fusarium poae]KAG8670830.1 hypothetical protein FPOAC1_004064 [Fusarium poae]
MTSYGDVRKIMEDVSMIINTFKGIYNATDDLEKLIKETEMLSQLADAIETNGTSFETNQGFQSILSRTKQCILNLKQHLNKKESRINRTLEKVKLAKQRNDLEKNLENARHLSNLLSQLNMTLSIRDISGAQRDGVVHDFIETWTPAMADALSKAYPRVQVTEGTGQWIQENDQYQSWEQSKNGVLWINGLQGCGKTGLAITIDDRFRARFPSFWALSTKDAQQHQFSPDFEIATIFCYHQVEGMRQLEDHMEILMSLWAQLVKLKPECRPNFSWIQNAKNNHQLGTLTGQRRVAFQKDLLKHALKHSGNTILILDGLDEIPRKLQLEVIKDLRCLQQENDHCRILITSRPYESITRIFKNDPQVYMEAPDVDLVLYMEERFSRHDWDSYNEFKCHDIIKILVPKCRQSFLLTQLLMDEVIISESKAHCERIISQLPSTVDEAYKRGLNRLQSEYSSEGLANHLPCMAIQALFWVAFLKTPLTADELTHALTIADGGKGSDSKVQRWRERGIDVRTTKLVVVDPGDGKLIIAHETLTRYLTKDETRLNFFPQIREHIHEVQLKSLLTSPSNSEMLARTKEEFFEQYPLIRYALWNWGDGLKSVLEQGTSLWKCTQEFLGTPFNKWNKYVQNETSGVFSQNRLFWGLYGHPWPTGSMDRLYWVVFYELQSFVPLSNDVDTE